jgi:hypothetical protein
VQEVKAGAAEAAAPTAEVHSFRGFLPGGSSSISTRRLGRLCSLLSPQGISTESLYYLVFYLGYMNSVQGKTV